MNTNPSERPSRTMHALKFTSEQVVMLWQLTEHAKPANGSAADLLTAVRNRLRPTLAKLKKAAPANGQRKPEMVRSGRST